VIGPEPAQRLHKTPTNAFAAPVFDATGATVMALTMISHVDRLDPDWRGAAPQALLKASRELSVRLGFDDTSPTAAAA